MSLKLKTACFFLVYLSFYQLAHSQSKAYLSARTGQYIQVINTTTHELSSTIGSAPGTPISTDTNWRNSERTLGISSDNQFLFQDCYNCGGSTKKINLIDGTVSNISGFSEKSGMVSNNDGTKIYTARAYYIQIYDVNTNAVSTLANRSTGTCSGPNAGEAYQSIRLALNSTGTKLYVGNLDPRNKGISVYDTSTGSEIKIHSAISGAQRLSISPDDKYVYVINTGWGYGACANDPSLMTDINGIANANHSNDIAIIDTSTNNVIDYINVGGGSDITISKDGSKIFVSTGSGIKVIERDLSNNTHSLSATTYFTGSNIRELEISPDDSFIYAVLNDYLTLKHLDLNSSAESTINTYPGVYIGNIVFETPPSAPTNISLSSSSVNENVSTSTTIGALTTADSDSGDTHTYTLVSGVGSTDNGSFSISGANLVTDSALDYETKSSYSIRVRTTDAGGLTYEEAFTITVTDVDEDSDSDGITNNLDNCPSTANADQADTDGDGVGDVCDNAPTVSNANQLDTDGDGLGDVIDTDDDGDGVADTDDAFPLDASESTDTDGDGVGDSADPDLDNDGVLDTVDNCLYTSNADQLDTDGDGIGNACDPDDDNDGFSDADEIICGTDPLLASSKPLDTDADGIPNCIDTDDDNDGVIDTSDSFPLDSTEDIDSDGDGIGDNLDTDDDNDGFSDADEIICGTDPLLASSKPLDTDADGIPNCIDTDDDNDGALDINDAFPLDSTKDIDSDGDGSIGQTVTNLNDSGMGSFRQAILDSQVNPGDDVISFTSGLSGTIILASDLPQISQTLTINGPSSMDITISGDDQFKMFFLQTSTASLTISNIIIENNAVATGANTASAFYVSNNAKLYGDNLIIRGNKYVVGAVMGKGVLTFNNSIFENNSGDHILFNNFGNAPNLANTPTPDLNDELTYETRIYVKNSTFRNNQAKIFWTERFLKIDNCVFDNNQNYIGNLNGINKVIVTNSQFKNNTSDRIFTFGGWISEPQFNLNNGTSFGSDHFLITNNTFVLSNSNALIANTQSGAYNSYITISNNNITTQLCSPWNNSPTFNNNVINCISGPSNISISSSSVNENVATGTTIGSLSSTDADIGDTFTYSLVAGSGDTENDSFDISGGNLVINTALDYETKNSYSIRVRTTDAGGLTYEEAFTITVNDIDEDSDGDGITNNLDNCPSTANADQADTDGDGIGDVCDNAPTVSNANQIDTDGDGLGDVIDTDDDGDGVADTDDAFPLDATESTDTDGDGVGDSADPDLDNDGVLDTVDNCLYTSNADQLDTDGDGIGNACDPDDDNDGFSDADEIICGTDPLLASSKPLDTDADGIPNCIDTDDDNDGVIDTSDSFPLDSTEDIDSDGDGIGDNLDTDDDGDGTLDIEDSSH